MTFDDWWHTFGSKFLKMDAKDNEEHTRRVARAAWFFAMHLVVEEWEKPHGLTDGRKFIERLSEMADLPDGA